MKSWASYLSLSFLAAVLPACSPEHRQTLRRHVVFAPKISLNTSIDTTATVEHQPTITIWIHGTRLFYMSGALRNFQFSKSGLHRACDYETQYHMHQIGKTLVKAAPHLFSPESVYIFGWSGKLDFGVREQSAELLHQEIERVSEEYQSKYGKKPAIRLITHSHGGNVALNLARIKSRKDTFCIDELVLLACPVQYQTASLIKDPLFKKIFCIYSQLDLFQILDPQGLYKNASKSSPWLSGRYFPEQDNLEQVTIKMNGRAIFHSEFVFPRFLTFLADIVGTMENWHKEIPEPKPFTKFIKMLHVRTNGKPFRSQRKKEIIT